jgi:hypothetical protein
VSSVYSASFSNRCAAAEDNSVGILRGWLPAVQICPEVYGLPRQERLGDRVPRKSRAGGAAVDPLTLGRCYWELSGERPPGGARTPGQCQAAAQPEYHAALAATTDEPLRRYLTLCLDAIAREADAGPATRP